MKISIALSLWIALAAMPAIAQTQTAAIAPQSQTEIAGEYTYVHSNAPPGGCGCFALNGGSASIAQPLGSGYWSAVFDATIVHAGDISSANYDVTLSIFTAGFRFRPRPRARWNPFGEILVGAEHASGSLVEGATPAAYDSDLVFAMNAGGGLDWRLSPRWSLRLAEADYLLTSTSNRTNDHQNNIRVSTGLVYHFGGRPR